MAQRTSTIDQLVARLQQLTDTQNDQHLDATPGGELFGIVNSAIAETWDRIIDAGLGEKYVKSVTFNTVAGQQAYPIFAAGAGNVGAQDFYRVAQLYVNEGNGQMRPLRLVNAQEVQRFRPPQTVTPIVLYYIPYSPVLTTGQTFDGINGWEEHTLMVAACAVKMKKDDDYSQYYKRQLQLEERMRDMGQTNFSEPKRVSRKRKRTWDPFMLYVNNINAYLVRGDNLELLYDYGYYP